MLTIVEALLRDLNDSKGTYQGTYQYVHGKLHGKVFEEDKEVYYWYGRVVTKEDFTNKTNEAIGNRLVPVYLNGEYFEVPYKKLQSIKELISK